MSAGNLLKATLPGRALRAIIRATPLLAGALLAMHAQADMHLKSLDAVAVATPPVIDGLPDEDAWRSARPITDFHLVEPVEFGTPSERTEVRVLHDRDNLYIAVQLYYSDIEKLTADILVPKRRLWSDDRFAVVLDPFLDHRNGYYFELNAHAILADALIENNTQMLDEWDGIWDAEANITDTGWTAEIRIPFATLSFNPEQQDWGINFFRDLRETQESMVWSSNGKQDFQAAPSLAGTLKGISGIDQGRGIDLIPSFSMVEVREFENGQTTTKHEPSLDATYRITPSLTAKLTLNTDFSATEVDDRQINLTRFSLFFPEKREFFLQDAGIFEFAALEGNGRPFFSRTVGLSESGAPLNLDAGVKLTGRVGDWNLGFLGVQQEPSNGIDAQRLLVGRAVANVLEESSVGVLVTDGDPRFNRSARTFGVDFRYRTSRLPGDRIFQGEAWYLNTDNETVAGEPGGGTGSAWGLHGRMPDDRHWVDLKWYRFGEGFDPAMGFVNRPGVTEKFFLYRFRDRPETGPFSTRDVMFEFSDVRSLDGTEQSEAIELFPFKVETRGSDELLLYIKQEREVLGDDFDLFGALHVQAGSYEYARYGMRIGTAHHRKVEFGARIEFGDFLDGERTSYHTRLEWKPSPHFNIRAEYNSNDVTLASGNFTARLYSLRAEYAFNNRLSFVPKVQFDNISEEMGINARLRWNPKRGQDVFLVWNRNLLRDLDKRFHSTSQESVIKAIYTMRF